MKKEGLFSRLGSMSLRHSFCASFYVCSFLAHDQSEQDPKVDKGTTSPEFRAWKILEDQGQDMCSLMVSRLFLLTGHCLCNEATTAILPCLVYRLIGTYKLLIMTVKTRRQGCGVICYCYLANIYFWKPYSDFPLGNHPSPIHNQVITIGANPTTGFKDGHVTLVWPIWVFHSSGHQNQIADGHVTQSVFN